MNANPTRADLDRLNARLDEIERKLDTLVEQQRSRKEMFDELGPIAREMLKVWAERLEELDRKGYFHFAREAARVVERVVEGYSPEDVRQLGDHIVGIMDTIRNVTQPAVLEVANEAAEVLQESDDVEPVGVWGMVRATARDEDVQKGMAVVLEVLRQVGRAAGRVARDRGDAGGAPRRKPRLAEQAAAPPAPRTAPARPAPAPAAAPAPAPAEALADSGDQEGWELDESGHLADPSQWTREFAEAMAMHLGVHPLSAEQWKVVEWARKEWEQTGAAPNIRRITTGMGIETRRLYQLFPKAPARTIARIAGIPKPAGCL